MHRIDTSGNVSGLFSDGVPGVTQATVVDDAWLNDMQEENMSILAAGGVSPVKGTQNQVLTAMENVVKTMVAPHVVSVLVPADITGITNGTSIYLTLAGHIGAAAGSFIAPFAGKVSNLYAASAGGGGQCGIGINAGTINTSIAATLNPGSIVSDTTHSATFNAGDVVNIVYNNNTGGTVTLAAGFQAFVEITRA